MFKQTWRNASGSNCVEGRGSVIAVFTECWPVIWYLSVYQAEECGFSCGKHYLSFNWKLGTPACAIRRRDCANSSVGRWNKKRDRKIMRVIWSAARLPVRIPRSALWTPHQHNDTMNCIINWDLPNKEQPATHGHTCTHTPGNRHAWHLKHTRSNTNTQTHAQLK